VSCSVAAAGQDRECGSTWNGRDAIEEILCVGGCGAHRRDVRKRAAPDRHLRSRFGLYFEDVDLGWRCRLTGGPPAWRREPFTTRVTEARSDAATLRRVPRRRNRVATLLKNASPALLLQPFSERCDAILLLARSGPVALATTSA
jgi:hypothetical protein